MAMRWELLRFPGRESLSRRVAAACGPGSQFSTLRTRFGDWWEEGAQAPPTYVTEVEAKVAQYLAQAARVGRRWGIMIGTACGLTGGLVAGVASWLWMVLR